MSKLLPLVLLGALAAGVTAACSDGATPTEGSTATASAALGGPVSLPIIGPEQCSSGAAKLHACTIPAATLEAATGTTAVPLRTTLTLVRNGTCATLAARLSLTLDVAGEPSTLFPFVQQPSVTLRRRDGGRIERVQVTDTYPAMTKSASFAGLDCRMRLDASFNEPDVYSADEARAVLARIEGQLAEKIRARDALQDLVGAVTALYFVRSTLDRFWSVLTAEELRDLRTSAESATGTLSTLAFGCGQLSDTDLANVMRIMIAIPALGSAGEFSAPDGGRLTLGDYLGANAPAVKASLERVVQKVTTDGGTVHDEDLAQANRAVTEAQAAVALARVQLAPWLTP